MMEINFKEYSNRKIEFYKRMSEIIFLESKYSIQIELDKDFFSISSEAFSEFIKERSTKTRLSKMDSKRFKEDFLAMFPKFNEIFSYDGPAVYWFTIVRSDNSDNSKIIKTFKSIREKKSSWWWSKPNINSNPNINILYLGKVESNLQMRFLQHLGFGHKKTSSLKLIHWFLEFPNTTLIYQFIKVEPEFKIYLDDIENVLWRELNPLLGAPPHLK